METEEINEFLVSCP